jgi:heme oxygenase (biliverdin-IX-beta and delta-forming)
VRKSSIQEKLRTLTSPVHERLHQHEGFAAAAAGTIDLTDYRNLLARLWGFHVGFEVVLNEFVTRNGFDNDIWSRRRSPLIEADLAALGVSFVAIAGLPCCKRLGWPKSWSQVMGSLYVVEGSTLGGLQIARALKSVVGLDASEGRRFFLGYGARHAGMWQEFLNQLERCINGPADEIDAAAGATMTFLAFESWMADWRGVFAEANGALHPRADFCGAPGPI